MTDYPTYESTGTLRVRGKTIGSTDLGSESLGRTVVTLEEPSGFRDRNDRFKGWSRDLPKGFRLCEYEKLFVDGVRLDPGTLLR